MKIVDGGQIRSKRASSANAVAESHCHRFGPVFTRGRDRSVSDGPMAVKALWDAVLAATGGERREATVAGSAG